VGTVLRRAPAVYRPLKRVPGDSMPIYNLYSVSIKIELSILSPDSHHRAEAFVEFSGVNDLE